MFAITAQVFELKGYKTSTFGAFSTLEKAKEAIEILVQRYRKYEDDKEIEYEELDDEDIEELADEYRSQFKIIPLSGALPVLDNLEFFEQGELPHF